MPQIISLLCSKPIEIAKCGMPCKKLPVSSVPWCTTIGGMKHCPSALVKNKNETQNLRESTVKLREILSSSQIQDDIFVLDLSAYPRGIYFAIINTDKGRSVEKIIFCK